MEFLLRVKDFQIPVIPLVIPTPTEIHQRFLIDWSFKERAYLVINSIKGLQVTDPFYLSKVIHLINQAGEYNRIFLIKNRDNLFEFGMFHDVAKTIINQNFEAFLK